MTKAGKHINGTQIGRYLTSDHFPGRKVEELSETGRVETKVE